MSQLDLARLQFAMTSIYHFLFVPVTIGLALLTALLQTAWYRGGQVAYLRLTRFFGTLLVINVAVGVVTGLVQEFQFGMDWSGYSRTVGDVFGAPLAMEGLAAFFPDWNGQVLGLNEVNSQYQQAYGPGDHVPDVFIQYWAMRVMAYLASLALLLGLWGLWLLRRERLTHARWFLNTAVWAVVLPFLINTSGWLLTENGRQPWIVQGLQLTKNGVSSSVSTAEVAISIVAFFLLYAAMAVIAAVLMTRHTRKGTGPLHQGDQPAPEMTY